MALLPAPSAQPPTSILSVMEVHLEERQCLPNLLVFTTGKNNTLFHYREVPAGRYSFEPTSGVTPSCLGATIDVTPACEGYDKTTGLAKNPSRQRVAVAISGVISLLCPHIMMKKAYVGQWVEVDSSLPNDIKFRGYGTIKPYDFFFVSKPSILTDADTTRILIGRLLIKDQTNNYITVDLCPL